MTATMIDLEHEKVDEVILDRITLPDGSVEVRSIALCRERDKRESFTGFVWCAKHGDIRILRAESNSE